MASLNITHAINVSRSISHPRSFAMSQWDMSRTQSIPSKDLKVTTATFPIPPIIIARSLIPIVLSFIAFNGAKILVKFQNDDLHVTLPWLNAFVRTLTWPVYFIALLFIDDGFRHVSVTWLWRYGVLGVADSVVISLRSFGLNGLPGDTYIVIKGTALVYMIILEWITLKHKPVILHIVGAIFVIGGATVAAWNQNDYPGQSQDKYRPLWIFCACGAALLGVILTVSTQKLLSMENSDERKPRQIVVEMSFYAAIFSSVIVIFPATSSAEARNWKTTFANHEDSNLLILSFIGILVCKITTSVSKCILIKNLSLVKTGYGPFDILRRFVILVVFFSLFRQTFSQEIILAAGLTFAGFCIYLVGAFIEQRDSNKLSDAEDNNNVESTKKSESPIPMNTVGEEDTPKSESPIPLNCV